MSGRKKSQKRIKQIIISVGDCNEIFELDKKEDFILEKDIVIQKTKKMVKKIKEYQKKNLKCKPEECQSDVKKKEVYHDQKDLFHELFPDNSNEYSEFFEQDIQEQVSIMVSVNKINESHYLVSFYFYCFFLVI